MFYVAKSFSWVLTTVKIYMYMKSITDDGHTNVYFIHESTTVFITRELVNTVRMYNLLFILHNCKF